MTECHSIVINWTKINAEKFMHKDAY